MKKRKIKVLKRDRLKLIDDCAKLRRTIALYAELEERVKVAVRKNGKLKQALVKLALKRKVDRARLDDASMRNDLLVELLRNGNQWLAASTMSAEYAAVQAGAKSRMLQEKMGMSLQEPGSNGEAPKVMEFTDEVERGRRKAFRNG